MFPGRVGLAAGILTVAALSMWRCAGTRHEPKVVGLETLQSIIASPGQEVLVINFWATWCAPCVKEMPLLEELGKNRDDVRVILVSMDLDLDPDPAKVISFAEAKHIKSRIFILDAGDPNEWINKIDSSWSGALPATLFVDGRTGRRLLIEKELHKGDLEELITRVQSDPEIVL